MKLISSRTNTSEITEVCSSIIDLNSKHTIAEDVYHETTMQKMVKINKELIKKINEGWLSNNLKEKDELRDTDVRAIFYEVEAKCNRRDSENRTKALRIMEILDRYGIGITADTFTNESTKIRAMISDLKAPELADDVSSIPDLGQLIVNMEESQNEFDIANTKFIEDKTERDSTKPASILAKEMREIFNSELCGYLTAMAKVMPEKYEAYTKLLSTLIDDTNAKVRDRIAALKKRKETENETDV